MSDAYLCFTLVDYGQCGLVQKQKFSKILLLTILWEGISKFFPEEYFSKSDGQMPFIIVDETFPLNMYLMKRGIYIYIYIYI